MIAATAVSWALSEQPAHTGSLARTLTTVAILIVAFAKVHYLGQDFMELRHAPRRLRLIFDGLDTGRVRDPARLRCLQS